MGTRRIAKGCHDDLLVEEIECDISGHGACIYGPFAVVVGFLWKVVGARRRLGKVDGDGEIRVT